MNPIRTSNASITFYGGAGTVTGANFLLTLPSVKILIDCGLTQGNEYCAECNYEPFPYSPGSIDFLFVTHAHADHIGRIPRLAKQGFTGVIVSTPATRELSEIMLSDAVNLLALEAKRAGKEGLYEKEDIAKALSLWKTAEYGDPVPLLGEASAVFKDAGHILGSAMVEFELSGKKIVFTGDLGNSPSLLLHDTEKITDADYIVMESVYGNRNHESRDTRVSLLHEAIESVAARKGVLLIPSFSIERTQEILYVINNLVEEGIVPKLPVFLDSPLAGKVTDIFKRYSHLFNERVQKEIQKGDDVFNFPGFFRAETALESKHILNAPAPKIIIAGSGMSVGGRVLLHEKHYLSEAKNILLLVGYQGVGTLGRNIEDGLKKVNIFGETIPVRAEVRVIRAFSAHKDSDGLVEFVGNSGERLQKVFVTMGEPKASLFLVQRLREYLGVDAVSPEKGETVSLDI
ncbi:MBL fold metallo-hydrolase [Candidatus Kaiserbacteria bacterium]|nr:MBL fold metallo-hydrolase [Candidatus Kaiserbacteria bacterium]